RHRPGRGAPAERGPGRRRTTRVRLMSQRHEPSAWSSEAVPQIEELPSPSRGGTPDPSAAAATSTLPTGLSRQGRPRYGEGALISCDNLVKIFKVADLEVVALQGLDLLVNAGEMIAIVGASGSGKSTLMNILGGLEVPSAGRAVVAGFELTSIGRRERTRYRRPAGGVGWEQTARNLLPYLSAVENVEMPMILDGRRKTRARATELLGLVGLPARLEPRPGRMSGGGEDLGAIPGP